MLRSIEQLESRLTPAVAAFTIDAPSSVIAGEVFQVGIYAEEFDPRFSGLGAVAVNLEWDASVLRAVSAEVTDALPAFRSGVFKDGSIRNLSGAAILSQGQGRAIGESRELFATVTFVAIGPGVTSLELSQGSSRIVSVPTATFGSKQLVFESHEITVGIGPLEQSDEGVQGNRHRVDDSRGLHGDSDLCFAITVQRTDSRHIRLGGAVSVLPPLRVRQ